MLSIMKAANVTAKPNKEYLEKKLKPKDIIVTKAYTEEEVNENGDVIIRKKTKLINITKLVNETKKAIKQQTALEKSIAAQEEMIKNGVI